MMLYIFVAAVLLALLVAFLVRATWAFSLPGLLLLMLILWLVFVA